MYNLVEVSNHTRLIIIALFTDDRPSRNPIPMMVIIKNYNPIK